VVGDGGPDLRSEFIGGGLAEAMLEQQVIPANDRIRNSLAQATRTTEIPEKRVHQLYPETRVLIWFRGVIKGMNVLVGYARVSTLDQNPQLQIDALKQAGCERLYVEKASGAHRDRPELKAALDYMRPGDTLVVWRLSRLARSLKQIIETASELEQRKQALKVLTRNIDTGTPEGRLFFHITAAFDEFQRELIVENTRAGLAAARKRGSRGGRPVLDKEGIRVAEAMLKDTMNYPFVGDVIDRLGIGRTAFYRYFPPDRIRELRNQA
jgi:DNA invertase Pin-like site-specific DNA recombinase